MDRIGNYVKDYLGNIVKITGYYNGKIYHTETKIGVTHGNKLEPIKITEEIMLKCDAYWDNILDEKDTLVIDVTEKIRIGWCGYLFLLIEGYTIQINNANSEYVHQLQNIYADLSGKELNINL